MSNVDKRSSDQKLQFPNGYAEIRGSDLCIHVDGYCKAMPLKAWMDAGWEPNARVAMQDGVINQMHSQNDALTRQCDELREIALLIARRLR